MSSVSRFVGLDYHQDSVQVSVLEPEGRQVRNRRVGNSWQEITAVVDDVHDEAQGTCHIQAAIEAGSGAAHLAEELMSHAGWTVTLAHPGVVNRMKQNPDKSDKTDAFILADLARLQYLPRVWLAPDEIRQLRSLVRYRAQKVKQRTQVKLRVRALLREHRLRPSEGLRPWTKAWLAWLVALPLDVTSAFLREEYLSELSQLDLKIREIASSRAH